MWSLLFTTGYLTQRGKAEGRRMKLFTEYLRRTISIRDTGVRKVRKENFYHGTLLGILGVKSRWGISSNREVCEGYADLLVEPDTGDTGIIIEVNFYAFGGCRSFLRDAQVTSLYKKKQQQKRV